MHNGIEVSFGQAARMFFGFAWRFLIICAIAGGIGYGALRFSTPQTVAPKVAQAEGQTAQAAGAAVTRRSLNPILYTFAVMVVFFGGVLSMKSVMGAEFGDFQVSVQSERRSASRSPRHVHSNPLSRNPQTVGLKPAKKIIYRN